MEAQGRFPLTIDQRIVAFDIVPARLYGNDPPQQGIERPGTDQQPVIAKRLAGQRLFTT